MITPIIEEDCSLVKPGEKIANRAEKDTFAIRSGGYGARSGEKGAPCDQQKDTNTRIQRGRSLKTARFVVDAY